MTRRRWTSLGGESVKKGHRTCLWLLLACVLIWLAIIGVCGAIIVHAEEPVAAYECCGAAEAVDKLQMKGYEHIAGVDDWAVLTLTEADELVIVKNDDPELISLGEFTITAYCPCERCCGKDPSDPRYGITATGTVATEGRTIAVDPSVLPYGTVVYIDGQAYTVEDCGSAIKKNRIDIFFAEHEEALQWGVQEKEVFIKSE